MIADKIRPLHPPNGGLFCELRIIQDIVVWLTQHSDLINAAYEIFKIATVLPWVLGAVSVALSKMRLTLSEFRKKRKPKAADASKGRKRKQKRDSRNKRPKKP